MVNEKLKQDLFDAMIRNAALEYSDALAGQLPPDSILQNPHHFSKKFEQRLLAKAQVKHRRLKTSTAFLVAIISIIFLAMTVTAVRKPIYNFFARKHEKYTTITMLTPDSKAPLMTISETFQDFLPSYIPSGFHLKDVYESENSLNLTYINDLGEKFVYYYGIDTGSLSIDTEDAEVKAIEIKGWQAVLSEKDSKTLITLITKNNEYFVSGKITAEEATNILKSVKIL